jgi:hypothetical protein
MSRARSLHRNVQATSDKGRGSLEYGEHHQNSKNDELLDRKLDA